MLKKHEDLFAGRRGEYRGEPVGLELKKGAEPHWSVPYNIPLKTERPWKKKSKR